MTNELKISVLLGQVLIAASCLAGEARSLAYGSGPAATGDLLLPENVTPETPVVLVIHGGGWTSMDKRDVVGIAEFFRRDLGFVAYNVNYRLASAKSPWPACGDDCLAAANFVFSDAFARASGVRPKRLWLCGGSAGGHLALWTALSLPSARVAGAVSISGIADPRADFAVHPGRYRALFGGAEPTPERLAAVDVTRLVKPNGPRLLLTHATGDQVVPHASAATFAAAYRAAGNRAVTLDYPCDLEPGLTGHCIWRPASKPRRLTAFLEHAITAFVRGSDDVTDAAWALPEGGLCAHRGHRAVYPENTVPAFRAAVDKGAAMVEFDVHRCKTGELIVMHDETIDRTTTGHGRWRDLSFAELRAVDAGVKRGAAFAGLKIPTFDEAIDSFPKYGVWLNVHCDDAVTDEVARKIKAKGRLRQAFIAANQAGVARARAAVPEIKVCLFALPKDSWVHDWSPAERRASIAACLAAKAEFMQPHNASFAPRELDDYHARGGRVNYFWCNKPSRLAALLSRGVDFPLTDDLEPMVAAYRELRETPCAPADPEFGFSYNTLQDVGAIVGRLTPPAPGYLRRDRRFGGIPSLAVSPKNGRLWRTFYAGPSDGEDSNNYVVLATRASTNEPWRDVLVYDPDGRGPKRAFDPEVWVAPDGRLRWTWTERAVPLRSGDANRWGSAHGDERLCGVTLDAENPPAAPFPAVTTLVKSGGVMMCKPIAARDGRWLYPVAFWNDDFSARLYASTDGGKTLAPVGGATLPARLRQFDEHNVVELSDGTLRVYMRTKGNGAYNAFQADSRDGGRTWDDAKPCPFPHPNSRLFLRRLKSGALLLVKNGSLTPPNDARDYSGRVDMTAYVSDDDGATWTGGLLLHKGYSAYPDGDQAPDGTIHVTFDGDRFTKQQIFDVAFTEADVRRAAKAPAAPAPARCDAVPTAPAKYRRPASWQPAPPFPKTLREIARDHSAETLARAKARMEKVRAVNRAGKYAPTAAGMDLHACPEWFVDAKLGMFVDWGLYSIASYATAGSDGRSYPDWYEFKSRADYKGPGSVADYHRKNWGEDFKPDHFIGLFRGEKFDAPKMMRVFRKCGAKYVVPFLKHHSGFCEWDSSFTYRDTADSPAKRDFTREMVDAARAEGLKFGVYNSQADEWEYPILQNDGSIKMKLWGGRIVPYSPDMELKASGKIAVKDFVYDYIVPQMTEFIDKYDPDILWYDADWASRAAENGSYDIAAYFYNRAEGRKQVCCNDRYGRLPPAEEAALTRWGAKVIGCRTVRGDFYTDEWGDTAANIDPKTWHPWESCSGISKAYGNHWAEELDPSLVMTDREFICHFTSIVARGGNLLLLVNLDGQGALPAVQQARLLSIGRWLEKYGEAIYSTRIIAPYSTPAVDYTRAKDGSKVYAIVKRPAREVRLACDLPRNAWVSVVGSSAPLPMRRDGKCAVVTLPPSLATNALPFALVARRAPTQAINLDDAAQRAAQPVFTAASSTGGPIAFTGPGGDWSYRFRITRPWCGELPQWPSVNLVSSVADWSAYDRLVIDLYNDAPGGDTVCGFLANAEGRIQNGLSAAGAALQDYGYTRWTIPLANWPKTCDPKRIARIHLFMTTPSSANILASGFYLLKPGEAAPPPAPAFIEGTVRPAEARVRKRALERRRVAREGFARACRAAGQDGEPAWIGKATSMERIRPREGFAGAAAADTFSLKAARGEREALQVLVTPSGERDLKGVSVEVSDLMPVAPPKATSPRPLARSAFTVAPVGYSRTVRPAPYRVGENVATNLPGGYYRQKVAPGLGWWPDPILHWLNRVDVKAGDVQSFWVRLNCPDDQPAGLYRGSITVRGENWLKTYPLSVRVWNFAVPKKSPLPLAITFSPGPSTQFADAEQLALNARLRADPNAPVNRWRDHSDEWTDFLADYYITRDSLYHCLGVDWNALERLKAQGRLGLFNLGYWSYPADLSPAAKADWLAATRRRFDAPYNKAKDLGLLSHAYLYGCDEIAPKYFENIRWAIGELKRLYPGVPLSTTAYDHAFGVGTPLKGMDWFTPTTDKFEENLAAVAPSHREGHQVWWYIACGQQAPRANLFVENQPIEARQLMGAQTVKYRPDGFLYYQVSIWNALTCIDGATTFTDWDPRSWTKFHGDGSWFCCGPKGIPAATVRIENFRDGLEDYAYALKYEQLSGKKAEVPPSVCRSVWHYTDNPTAYYAWRDHLAEGIEHAQNAPK